MTLTDTSALVALIDDRDPNHARCQAALPMLSIPLITTLPCLTEAHYLLFQVDGGGKLPCGDTAPMER